MFRCVAKSVVELTPFRHLLVTLCKHLRTHCHQPLSCAHPGKIILFFSKCNSIIFIMGQIWHCMTIIQLLRMPIRMYSVVKVLTASTQAFVASLIDLSYAPPSDMLRTRHRHIRYTQFCIFLTFQLSSCSD